MLYIFIDESGDLGFTERSTKYYVIASVETRNLLNLTRIIKRVRKTLRKKRKNIPELKFARSDDVIRKRLLKKAVEEDLTFSAIVLQKYVVLKDEKDELHKCLADFIAELLNEYDKDELVVVIDKFMKKGEYLTSIWNITCIVEPKIFQIHQKLQSSTEIPNSIRVCR